MENIENTQSQIIVVYSSYTEAQKRATEKYRKKNLEKFNEHAREYYNKMKNDPVYIEKRKEICRRSYEKRRLAKLNDNVNNVLLT